MDDHYSSKLSPLVDYAAGTFLMVVAVLSFVGNSLVLFMAYKRRNHVKPPELLSVNLAVTDLGAAVTMYPLAVISSWSHRWVGGQPSCLYYGLMGFFFGVASIATLTEMAVVRFVVSLSVHSPREKISRRKVHIMIVGAWLYGLLWALLPLLGWGQYGPEPFGTSCSLAWGDLGQQDSSFVFTIFTMVLVIPAVIIIVCYFGLVLKMHLTYKSINNIRQIPNVIKTQRKLMIISVLVSVGFIGSWTPYAVVSLWSVLHHSGDSPSSSIPAEVGLLPCLFAKSSTVFNPIVYYLYSSNFRNEVQNLWCDCWRVINMKQQDSCVLAQHDWNKPSFEQNGGTDCLQLQAVGGESTGNDYCRTPATLVQLLHTEGHVNTEL